MSEPYKPIACSIYDSLEEAAVRKRPIEIRFNGKAKLVRIKDLRTKDQVEYLIGVDVESGEEVTIRLDHIEAFLDARTKQPHATDPCT